MTSHSLRTSLAVFVGLFALIGMWLLLGWAGAVSPVAANPGTLYVATTGVDNNLCSSSQPCRTLQRAVDLALSGDTIKVAAGQYTGVSTRFNPFEGQTVTQVVYISKTVTIRGGYTTAFTEPPNPEANPTIFDAQKQGRVFHIFGDNIAPTLEGVRITGGKALTGTFYGGGVYISLAQPQISHCQIYNNIAEWGGGLWLDHSPATLTNNSIYSNTATNGGGIFFNLSDNVRLSGNTLYTNTAGYAGGGFYLVQGSNIQIENNTIISNSAVESGGGFYLATSQVQISNNKIAANYAGYSGGGLYLSQSATRVNNNALVSNTAAYDGGGVYLSHSTGDVLVGNIVSGNTVSREGGGVFIGGGTPTLNWNIIQANHADYGGGFSMWTSSTSFNGNKVLSNLATYDGGAFYLPGGNVVTMTNMVIADNQITSGDGSGLYIAGSVATLLHTTVARNTGSSGRGLYLSDDWGAPYSTVTLTNSLIANQTVGVFADISNTARLESTLWNGNGADTGGAGTINLAHNYTGNPLFAVDGYHILSGSAALDKGVNTGLNVDIDPEPRPYLAPDLGADEYWPAGTLRKVYLPLILKMP